MTTLYCLLGCNASPNNIILCRVNGVPTQGVPTCDVPNRICGYQLDPAQISTCSTGTISCGPLGCTDQPAHSTSAVAPVATTPLTTSSGLPNTSTTSTPNSTVQSPTPPGTNPPLTSGGGAQVKTKANAGATAGAAIGGLVGGFLLAGLIFFFLLQRRKRTQPSRSYEQHVPTQAIAASYAEKGYAKTTVAPIVGGIDRFLPQPVEDNKILNELSNLRDKIKLHAQSYYHGNAVDASQLNESSLHGISRVIGISTPVLRDILLNPKTRMSGIRACIAGVIFGRFGGLKGIAGDSILPSEMASSADAFENVRDSDHAQLLSKSKVISGTIFKQHTQSNFQGDDQSIARAIKSINDIVGPFAQKDAQRLQNLDGILRRASQLAVLLFSQPSLWRFDWRGSNASAATGPQKGIVVMPALLQIAGDEAELLNPPRIFFEAEVVD